MFFLKQKSVSLNLTGAEVKARFEENEETKFELFLYVLKRSSFASV